MPVSDHGALLRPRRLRGVELPIALFDAASPLVPGNGAADMVRASPLACSGDFLLRLAACQGKDLIAEASRVALADNCFRGCGPCAPARSHRGNSAIEAKMNRCPLLGCYIQQYSTRQ